ncbi:tether containing UBX domain for GLUT4 [Anopheles ziemanni]|uniref:tether containing UBX domain for GLUT4 n=1 Tax=Anopheles ziemanni TaxID=345580 RepID=UPI0026604E6A|nr:tether containing UBX domain for GLUT4 [Anopheles ziemanni]
MTSRAVTVLTVHGRRLNVKVEPNMTILEVLETVCRKYNFSPDEYGLTHHNRMLDLTTMFRFSGLPNNALLEMVQAKQARTEEDVTILLQLEDGTRPSGTFKPSDTLLHVLQTLYPDRSPGDAFRLMVYMRCEVYWDAMSTTTLKSLGLCNGRATLRLLQRMPGTANTQANVSAPLPAKKQEIPETTHNIVPLPTPSTAQQTVPTPEPEPERPPSTEHTDPTNDDAKKPKTDATPSKTVAPKETVPVVRAAEPPTGQIVIIGERQAVLYHVSTSECAMIDPDDTFFDLSVPEVLQMQKQLQDRVKAFEDAPLVTRSVRELERQQSLLSSMTRYRQAVIRVQFPDRHVLQGNFQVHETVQHIEEFVRGFLADAATPFHLYTTPPKVVLDSTASLLDAGCFPLALLHFGRSQQPSAAQPGGEDVPTSGSVCVLRPELLSQLSDANGAAMVASLAKRVSTGRSEQNSRNEAQEPSTGSSDSVDEPQTGGPSQRYRNRLSAAAAAATTNSPPNSSEREAKILKFLKK